MCMLRLIHFCGVAYLPSVQVLPEEFAAITSIDMQVGNTPVDPSYMNITHHKKWAIPWMEVRGNTSLLICSGHKHLDCQL